MKNSAKFVLTLALTVASAASCHKEIAVRGDGSAELTLNPQVDVLTKAPIAGATFPNDRTIVLSAAYHNVSGSSANYFQGITFSKDATLGSWVGGGGSNPKYWPVSGSLDLLAYSADGFTTAPTPSYATKCSESVALAVPSENKTKQVDILFAGATGKSATGSALDMQFKHAQAVVAFNAKAQVPHNPTTNLGVTINSITLKGVKTYGTVTLNINGTCSWSGGTAEDVGLPGIPSGGYNVTGDYIPDTTPFAIGGKGLIVIPQTATSFTVNYTVHYGKDSSSNLINKNETFTYIIPSATWAAGKEYVYQLEFKQDQILVNSTILNWEVIPGGVTVPDKVSATYKDSDLTKTDIDLCAPGTPAKLSAGAIVGFDWGDGRYEIIENTTGSEMTLASIPHKYPAPPTGSVNIYVRKGTLDFGELEPEYFNLFNVYKDTEVIVALARPFTINKATATNGSFTVSPEEAYRDEIITISPSPNTDYVVNEVKYNDGSDHTVSPTLGVYKFFMPAADVTVTVTFKRETGTINGHDYVKIAGIKWAKTNIGASSPSDYGDMYSWGEVTTKSDYSESKYTASGISGNILPDSGKDAARHNWGSTWRMPTSTEFQNLFYSTTRTWRDSGYYVTDKGVALKDDKSNALLFFPAAGDFIGTSRYGGGSYGYYWSSSLYTGNTDLAYALYFDSEGVDPQINGYRYYGRSVRPVSD